MVLDAIVLHLKPEARSGGRRPWDMTFYSITFEEGDNHFPANAHVNPATSR